MTTTSILPPNLSELERDLDAALSRLADIEIPIAQLWDPWQCPADVLPYLAWALSVDLWRSNWPEKIKRQVVAGSLQVHRTKGTRPAVEKALQDLGVTVDLVEWFEASPQLQRGTFELTAWVNENLTPGAAAFLNQALYDQLQAAVDNAKNVRSHYTFKVGAKFDNGIGMAAAVTGVAALAKCATDPGPFQLDAATGLVAGMAGHVRALTRQTTQLTIDAAPRPASVMVAGAFRAATIIYRRMEATT